ncbi:hyaluronan-mediated motility receptor-like [Parasteatoda tepidariorum]|uniref:hyaluronan-mediated motility receptor-like n=1 Tax=Parasteatoda tepidariorum TaxID=114398 RepID=UPI0039BCC310
MSFSGSCTSSSINFISKRNGVSLCEINSTSILSRSSFVFQDIPVRLTYKSDSASIIDLKIIFTAYTISACEDVKEYKCLKEQCVWAGLVCDGENNCGDYSEEAANPKLSNCEKGYDLGFLILIPIVIAIPFVILGIKILMYFCLTSAPHNTFIVYRNRKQPNFLYAYPDLAPLPNIQERAVAKQNENDEIIVQRYSQDKVSESNVLKEHTDSSKKEIEKSATDKLAVSFDEECKNAETHVKQTESDSPDKVSENNVLKEHTDSSEKGIEKYAPDELIVSGDEKIKSAETLVEQTESDSEDKACEDNVLEEHTDSPKKEIEKSASDELTVSFNEENESDQTLVKRTESDGTIALSDSQDKVSENNVLKEHTDLSKQEIEKSASDKLADPFDKEGKKDETLVEKLKHLLERDARIAQSHSQDKVNENNLLKNHTDSSKKEIEKSASDELTCPFEEESQSDETLVEQIERDARIAQSHSQEKVSENNDTIIENNNVLKNHTDSSRKEIEKNASDEPTGSDDKKIKNDETLIKQIEKDARIAQTHSQDKVSEGAIGYVNWFN